MTAAYDYFEQAGDANAAVRVALYPLVETGDPARPAVCERALSLASPGSAEERRLRWLKVRADFLRTGDRAAAQRALEEIRINARRQTDIPVELNALNDWVYFASAFGPGQIGPKLRRALQLIRQIDDPIAELHVHFRAYHVALADTNLGEAAQHVAAVGALAARLRVPAVACLALLVELELAWVLGDLKAALAASDRAIATQAGNVAVYRQHLGVRARLELELGNTEAGQRYLARYLEELRRVGRGRSMDSGVGSIILSEIARLTGDPVAREAARSACEPWSHLGNEAGITAVGPAMHALLGQVLLAAVDGDKAAAQRLRPAVRHGSFWIPGLDATQPRLEGYLDMTLGDPEAAVQNFDQALALYRQRGRPQPDLAWTCFECAEALVARGGRGDRKRAAELLTEGLKMAESLGLKTLAARIRALAPKACG